jgi:hypothetical protein
MRNRKDWAKLTAGEQANLIAAAEFEIDARRDQKKIAARQEWIQVEGDEYDDNELETEEGAVGERADADPDSREDRGDGGDKRSGSDDEDDDDPWAMGYEDSDAGDVEVVRDADAEIGEPLTEEGKANLFSSLREIHERERAAGQAFLAMMERAGRKTRGKEVPGDWTFNW